jgi:hypothetical protein
MRVPMAIGQYHVRRVHGPGGPWFWTLQAIILAISPRTGLPETIDHTLG